jgi:hypothetical protein
MNMHMTSPFGQQIGVIAAALPTAGHSRSEGYRAHAAECQGIADRSPALIKHQYQELARQWLVLAAQAERRSQV